jgi:threonyl-tRNA synthetase
MVALTFPDGARREYPQNTTGLDIAKGISPSLAKRTVAMALDGQVADLSEPIEHDAKIEFLTRDAPRTCLPKPCRACGRVRKSPSGR